MILMAPQDKCCGLLELLANVHHDVQLLPHTSHKREHSHLSPFEVILHKEALVLQSPLLILSVVQQHTIQHSIMSWLDVDPEQDF